LKSEIKKSMLELRPVCENCGKHLPPNSTQAMICTFECTFCSDCVGKILYNVCPNCGGGLEKRPVRPQEKLIKHPAKAELYQKPVDQQKFDLLLAKYRQVLPENR
jgi:uncharacterized protein